MRTLPIIFLFFLSSCISNQRRIQERRIQEHAPSQQIPGQRLGFYLANTDVSKVDASTLLISQLSVARQKMVGRGAPHITFGAVGNGDFVTWSACPDYSPTAWKDATPNCHNGQTISPFLDIFDLETGPWILSLQYCVSKEHALTEQTCSATNSIKWTQDPAFDQQKDELAREITGAQNQIKGMGSSLQKILNDFNKALATCDDLKLGQVNETKKQAQSMLEMIQVESENLTNLGPDFLGSALVQLPKNDDDVLAQIIDDVAVGSVDDSYIPQGIMLAAQSTEQSKTTPTNSCPPKSASQQLVYALCPDCFDEKCKTQKCSSLPSVNKADIQGALLGISGAVIKTQPVGKTATLSCDSPQATQDTFGNSRQENLRIAICKVLLDSPQLCPDNAQKAASYLAVLKTINDIVQPPVIAPTEQSQGYFDCHALSFTSRQLNAFRQELERLQNVVVTKTKALNGS